MRGVVRSCLATVAVMSTLYACSDSQGDATPEPTPVPNAAPPKPGKKTPAVDPPPETDAGVEEWFPPPDLTCPPAEPALDAGSVDGGSLDGGALPKSTGGTRLKAVHVTTTDGLNVFVGVRDTLANRQCMVGIGPSFSYTAPFPSSPSKCTLPDEGNRFYLDAACTQSVLGDIGKPPANTELIVSDAAGMAKVKTGADLGAINAYTKTASGCWPMQVAAIAIASEEPITEVAFTANRVALSKRLEAIVWSGSDGSSIFAGDVHDNFFDAPLLRDRGRWEPFRTFVGTPRYFPHPNWMSSSCPPSFELFETKDAPAPGTVLVWNEKLVRSRVVSACGCAGVNPKVSASFSCAPPGPAVEYLGEAPGCFFLPAPFGDSTGTRLTVNRPSLAGQPISKPVRLPSSVVLTDSTLGVPCHPEVASDGVLRCLPLNRDSNSSFIGFSDAACTTPVVVQGTSTLGKYARRHLSSDETCENTVYAPGAALGMGDYFQLTWNATGACEGQCVKASLVPRPLFTPVVVDPSIFMPVTLEER